jgi:regulatory protein
MLSSGVQKTTRLWQYQGGMAKAKPFRRRERTVPRPLDARTLTDIAYHYAGRYAVSEARLARYLTQKVRQRGWASEMSASEKIAALVAYLVDLHAVDDAAVAASAVATATRKGLAGHRVRAALAVKQVRGEVATEALASQAGAGDEDVPLQTALRYAERKRLGPWRRGDRTPEGMKKEIASLVRAGHSYATARHVILLADPGDINHD